MISLSGQIYCIPSESEKVMQLYRGCDFMCVVHLVQNRPRLFIHLFSPVHLGSCVPLRFWQVLLHIFCLVEQTVILKPERIKCSHPLAHKSIPDVYKDLAPPQIQYGFNFNGLCPLVYRGSTHAHLFIMAKTFHWVPYWAKVFFYPPTLNHSAFFHFHIKTIYWVCGEHLVPQIFYWSFGPHSQCM